MSAGLYLGPLAMLRILDPIGSIPDLFSDKIIQPVALFNNH
jgi:hypothetical protein